MTLGVEPDIAQLTALVAIVDHGSFEAAARALHITASAVSQRIKALEASAGQVLLVRSNPVRATEAGQTLVRLGRQMQVLIGEARAELEPGSVAEARIAVNADSLATWFSPVIAEIAGWERTALKLYVDDEAWSHQLLRSGEVLAAVTSDPTPVQGCSVQELGSLRYLPVAVPRLAALDWAERPVVVFNEKDALQSTFLQGLGESLPEVIHRVPSSTDFAQAVRYGLGWGLLPEPQAARWLHSGELVQLEGKPVEVALYWQRWRLTSALLDRLTEAVLAAAPLGGSVR